MRSWIIAVTVSIPSLALAQPGATAPIELTSETAEPAPQYYLQPGVTVGALRSNSSETGALYGALTVEGGRKLGGSLWAHGQLATGSLAGIDEGVDSSSYFELRGGIEARACTDNGIACIVGGVDLGLRAESMMAEYDRINATNFVVVPRVGLDIGSQHFRLRPSIELAAGTDGNGGGLSLGAAYVW